MRAGPGGGVKELSPGPRATAHMWLRLCCFSWSGTTRSITKGQDTGAEEEARLCPNGTWLVARSSQRAVGAHCPIP